MSSRPSGIATYTNTIDISISHRCYASRLVIYSHCHGGHFGWAATFTTNAVHVMHKAEYEYGMFGGCLWSTPVKLLFQPLRESGMLS